MCYHILMLNNQESPQAIGEHVVKVPKLLMELINTTDESFWTDSSIVLTRTQNLQQAGRHL